jgi:hypothetical protein
MAGLVVLLVGLVAAGVVVATNGDAESADGEGGEEASPASTTSTSSTTTTTRPTTTTAPPWQGVTSADGAFQVELPNAWGSITVTGDMAGRGNEMFPGRPERAALADQVLSILVTPQTRFVAMDGDGPSYVEYTDMLLVESGPANVSQEAAYDTAKRYTEDPIEREGRVQTPVGEVGWFEFSPEAVPTMVARKYVLVHDGAAWVLTYWSGDMAGRAGTADGIAGSFTPATLA